MTVRLEELLPYYEQELSNLRELTGEFARQFPKIAGRLQLEGEHCADPHTERLIESFAFLASRVHHKLDDEYPEIAESLLEVLYPHFLRPIPSSAIVQFWIDPGRPKITKRATIERHRPVTSPLIGDIACKFRTCYPVDLYPLALTRVRFEHTSGSSWLRKIAPDAAAVLTLELKASPGLLISGMGLTSLRFFLDGDPALRHLVHEMLLTRALRIRVGDGSNALAHTRELPASCIAPVGFGRDEGMLEYDDRSFLGYRLLTEYFSYPEKFLFLDFLRLNEVAPHISGGTLIIQCMIDRAPDTSGHQRLLNELSEQHFKLGCTPIINLFEQAAEPIHVTHRRESWPIRASNHQPRAFEVIQVKRVTRIERTGLGDRVEEVPPYYAIRHNDPDAGSRFYWHATRKQSVMRDDRGTELELHLADLCFEPARPGAEVLSLDLLCSNRDLPEQIPFGGGESAKQSDFDLPGNSIVARVRLLRKPTQVMRAPQRRGLQWRLISHLSLNYLSLVEGGHDALKEMLSLYDFSQSPVAKRQIEGIVAISSKPTVTRVVGPDFSGFARGTEITLTLNENHYVGGSFFLFASILERLFALSCSPNSFTRLRVRTVQQKDEEVAAWPARSGEALVV